jgi:hypothetical protein
MHEAELLLLSGLAVLGLGVFAIRMYFNGQQQKHEREHLERMKALEMGLSLPQQSVAPAQAYAYRLGLLIGGVVPVGVFVSTALASIAVGFHEGMWIAAALVGLGGVISGTVLSSIMSSFGAKLATNADEASLLAAGYKPRVEDDAYDVVSARG